MASQGRSDPENSVYAIIELGPRDDFDHVKTQLLLQCESARFPNDEEFLRTLESADLYSRPCVQHVLASLENHGRKEVLPPSMTTTASSTSCRSRARCRRHSLALRASAHLRANSRLHRAAK